MSSTKERSSNIELFRIVLMIIIITHHYVVNSGIVFFNEIDSIDSISRQFVANTLISQIFGWGGKMAIDGFIIITGYYMCEKEIRIHKWVQLLIEVFFYNIVINGIFLIVRYEPCGKGDLLKGLCSYGLISGLETGKDSFISHYLLLYLLIPYINRAIKGLERNMYRRLLITLLSVYTCITTLSFGAINTFSAMGCYIMIYLIGAYIRKYTCVFDSKRIGGIVLCVSITLLIAYIFVSDYCRYAFNMMTGGGYWLVDSICKPFAIIIAVSMFIVFKNVDIKSNRIINLAASTTLGVLLIHANSDTMRHFIWNDMFDVKRSQGGSPMVFLIRIILIPPLIFAACSVVDLLRQRLFAFLSKKGNLLCQKSM